MAAPFTPFHDNGTVNAAAVLPLAKLFKQRLGITAVWVMGILDLGFEFKHFPARNHPGVCYYSTWCPHAYQMLAGACDPMSPLIRVYRHARAV